MEYKILFNVYQYRLWISKETINTTIFFEIFDSSALFIKPTLSYLSVWVKSLS